VKIYIYIYFFIFTCKKDWSNLLKKYIINQYLGFYQAGYCLGTIIIAIVGFLILYCTFLLLEVAEKDGKNQISWKDVIEVRLKFIN
jgi:hypothetical protein